MKSFQLLLVCLLFTTSCKKEKASSISPELLAKATEIHKRVITLDTHNDIDVKNFTDTINYSQELDNQVNLPKMKKGGLDVSWFIVYTRQDSLNEQGYKNAYANAISKFNAIHKLVEEIAPNEIELALTSEDVRRINSSGKKIAMIGIENGYPIGMDINRVKEFYDLGGRYMSLSHNGHNQLSDSNTGEKDDVWLHNGLSDLGREVIAEMNKWGIMIDVSHPSKKAMQDMIALSKAPIIASHSTARALGDHSRNLDDEQLEWIQKNGGVVQTVAFKSYLNPDKYKKHFDANKAILDSVAFTKNFTVLDSKVARDLPEPEKTDYYKTLKEIEAIAKKQTEALKKIVPPVDVSDFVDHIDYMVAKIGIDHVGISSDFDGGGGIEGWSDASETLNVTIELVKRGYTEVQITQIWSGNLLRVLDDVQAIAKKIQKEEL